MLIRALTAGDEARLEAFLVWHRDTSMFLRSNVRRAGLEYRGQPLGGTYVAGIDSDEIVGVVAHSSSGMLLLQAPTGVDELVPACLRESGRALKGFSGPLEQVRRARELTGRAAARLENDEALFGLDLDALVVPPLLLDGTLSCRRARAEDVDVVGAWRHAYNVEVNNGDDSEEAKRGAAKHMAEGIAAGHWWLVCAGREPVALAGYNASLPDMVQLGGVYTPPALRNQGYARAVVAGCLRDSRAEGVTRAVLFTASPSAAHAYEAVGFRCIGGFGIVVLK